MATKREYLMSLGLAKARGRFSAAAKEAAAKAVNKGVVFDEPEVIEKTVTIKTKNDKGQTVVKTKRVDDVPQVPDARPDRPRGMYVFRNPDKTTFQRSDATACYRCSYSLAWCYCPDGPVVLAYPYRGTSELATMHRIPSAVITTKEVPEKQPTRGTGGTRRGGTRGGRRRR